jgi:hypothetical protein
MKDKDIGDLGLVPAEQGKYRILVFYMDDFSAAKTNRGILSLFLAGREFEAEGDTKVYECPNPTCNGVLEPIHYDRGTFATCPSCKRTFPRKKLVGEMAYDGTADKWAEHIARYVRALEMNCDIFLKRAKTSQSMIEAEMTSRVDKKGAEMLKTSRRKEEALYTMARIVQDVTAGQPLQDAIRSFLLA